MDLSTIAKDTKIILTSGCSYSVMFAHLNAHFKNVQLINLGEGGRSNKWIAQSLIYALEQLKDHPRENIFVIGMFSSVDRQDLFVDKHSNRFHKKLDFLDFADPVFFTEGFSYRQYKWYNHIIEGDSRYDPDRMTGLLSMTNLDKNSESEYVFEEFAGKYYTYFHNNFAAFDYTLQNIIALQNYCKLSNTNYLMLSWQDIFHDTSFDKFFIVGQTYDGNQFNHCDYSTLMKRIDCYPELRYLYNQIDFSNWWFNDTERCSTGGLADWCIENGPGLFGSEKDNCHPTKPGYKEFARKVLAPLVTQKTGWSTIQR